MNPVPCAPEADALATRLSRRCLERRDFRYLRQAREVVYSVVLNMREAVAAEIMELQ